MNVSLTPELNEYVSEKVKGGLYTSASEVIREGLRLMKEQDLVREARLTELRHAVQAGIGQLENGRYTEYESADALQQALQAEMRQRFAQDKGDA